MKSFAKEGYFTTWVYDERGNFASHRVYYNDIDIATANLICDGVVVGNARQVDRHMAEIDRKNNYLW